MCKEFITQACPYRYVQKALQKRLELDLEAWEERKGELCNKTDSLLGDT